MPSVNQIDTSSILSTHAGASHTPFNVVERVAASQEEMFMVSKGAHEALRGSDTFRSQHFDPTINTLQFHQMVMGAVAPERAPQAARHIDNIFKTQLGQMNEVAKALRSPLSSAIIHGGAKYANALDSVIKGREVKIQSEEFGEIYVPASAMRGNLVIKSVLDVGTQSNWADVTGGQTLSYFSLDTQLARATQRKNSFTLWQILNKTRANQVVDFWGIVNDVGGGLPGTATGSFTGVSTGILPTNVGSYKMNQVNLKLMYDGRAITLALGASNNYVDVENTEVANAMLNVFTTADYLSYWGNSTLFPNQFDGLATLVPAANVFDFGPFYAANIAMSWSPAQALFNMIYEVAATVTDASNYGVITHVLMDNDTIATLQQLPTTNLNNILQWDIGNSDAGRRGIGINGKLTGMDTNFGFIQFVKDIWINSRDVPPQGSSNPIVQAKATTSLPSNPASVTPTVETGVAGSQWSGSFVAAGNSYVYAVSSLDQNTVESVLTYSSVVTGIAAGDAVSLSIAAPTANDGQVAYRVYRSGNGYALTGGANLPAAFRYVGVVAANGTAAVNFVDLNTKIPGYSTLFLVDLAENDNALDVRMLLPMSRVDLFTQNLSAPFAITMIGALRVRVPQFHAIIKNFQLTTPKFSALAPNYSNL